MASQRRGKIGVLHRTFYTNICYLMNSVRPTAKFREVFAEDMFVHSNMQGFLEVMHYLLNIWDEAKSKEKFKYSWPVSDAKQKSQFQRGACSLLQEIKTNHPEAQLPNISLAMFLQPGGDKFCAFMLRFSTFIVSWHLRQADSSVLFLPVSQGKCSKTVKTALQAKMEPELRRSLEHHAASVAAISKAEQFAQKYIKTAYRLTEEEKKVSSDLKNMLLATKVQEKIVSRIIDPKDSNALKSWQTRVQSKRDYMEQLLEKLQGNANSAEHCKQAVESLLVFDDSTTLDGNVLKPVITADLCSKLSCSEEDLRSRLLAGEQLTLQGLVEIGSAALQALTAQWVQRDSGAVEAALPRFRALVEQSEKQAEAMCSVEGQLKQMSDELEQTEAKFRQELDLSAWLTRPPTLPALSNAASMLQIPCTPPLQLRNEVKVGTGSPFLIKRTLLPGDDTRAKTESFLKLWYGEKPSTLPSPAGDSSFDSPSSFTLPTAELRSERQGEPLSPKRSHSPAGQDGLRSCLSQQRQPAAPPPPKDARLSGMRPKSLISRYTPTFKQAMHHRLLQVPSKIGPKDLSSPILFEDIKKTPQGKNIKSEWPSTLKKETFLLPGGSRDGLSSSSGGILAMSRLSLSSRLVDLDSSSSDFELPLGDVSLQEIAELHLSLDSTPSHSPMAAMLRAANSPATPSCLSPPAAGAQLPLCKIEKATPLPQATRNRPEITTIMQRLQAIKTTMKQKIEIKEEQESPSLK